MLMMLKLITNVITRQLTVFMILLASETRQSRCTGWLSTGVADQCLILWKVWCVVQLLHLHPFWIFHPSSSSVIYWSEPQSPLVFTRFFWLLVPLEDIADKQQQITRTSRNILFACKTSESWSVTQSVKMFATESGKHGITSKHERQL